MPDESWYTRVESKIDQVLDVLHGDSESPSVDPGVLLAPTGFSAVYDATTRTVACSWDPQQVAVQLHEFETDPANTLKATLGPGVTSRVSSPLRGGHPYTWAARSVRDGTVSVFTPKITTEVPVSGAPSTPQEPEPQEPSTGEWPIDLRFWTLMLPVMKPDGDTPMNDYPAKFSAELLKNYFFTQNGAVVCRAPANGAHSKNSKYVRTELRQMIDADWNEAAFPSSGDRSLECDMYIDASNLSTRQRVNGMQIHDGGDDVCQIMRHERDGFGLMHSDGKAWESIDPTYRDGQRFKCRIHAVKNRIKVYYNGALAVDIPKTGSGWYWKMGCYNQSGGASTFIEPASAYGEVGIYSYTLTGGGS